MATGYSRDQEVELLVRTQPVSTYPGEHEGPAVYVTLWSQGGLLRAIAMSPEDARRLAGDLVRAAETLG
jgi:hypothetical protein